MYCPNCGQEISQTAKFCTECGAPVSPRPVETSKPTPIYKHWWFWVIVVLAVALICSVAVKPESKPAQTPPVMQTEAPVYQPAATEAPAYTAPAAEAPAAAASADSASIDTAMRFIDSIMADNFAHYELSYEDNMITIDVWDDGIAMGVALAASGDRECLESWDVLVNNQLEFCASIESLLETLGLPDVSVLINTLNDGNLDNVLLSVLNGIVLFDAVND